jgi:Putative DNA-binding domain
MSLASYQDAFTNALLSPKLDDGQLDAIPNLQVSGITAKQFEVYRELALADLRKMLARVYPTVAKLMAPDDFRKMSNEFFAKHTPHSVNPVTITELFATFLETELNRDTETLREQGYLPDLATLDYGCYQAQNAVDATAVNMRIFTDLTPEMLTARRVQLHPACYWLSSQHAIYDLWHHEHSQLRTDVFDTKRPQEVVIIRPKLKVEVHRADAGLVKTLDALDDGATLNNALMQGNLADAGFNAVGAMQFLIQNELIISLY